MEPGGVNVDFVGVDSVGADVIGVDTVEAGADGIETVVVDVGAVGVALVTLVAFLLRDVLAVEDRGLFLLDF